jgi:zinc transport system substrate-binding protein
MKRFFVIFLSLLISGSSLAAKPVYVATTHPLAVILQEIVGDKGTVKQLIPPGASPHTYEPRPSDLKMTESAGAFFYTSRNLDGWATRLSARKRIEVFEGMPASLRMKFTEHHHEGEEATGHGHESGKLIDDPHFWTDPMMVKALLPSLVKQLAAIDPANAKAYQANANQFSAKLDALDKELAKTLAPVKGKPVFLFHPSFQYMLRRYGLVYAGVIEPFPGKEPAPKYLKAIIQQLHQTGAKAIFIEPQLSRRPAEVVAESAKVKVAVLDPNGGVPGRMSYDELLKYNAQVLAQALK